MEALATAIIGALAKEGLAYALLALTFIVIAYLFVQWRNAEQKCFDLSQTLQEKRVSERSETIAVLHAGAEANKKLADSISVRTETLNNLITVVTSSNERLERLLADVVRRIEGLRVVEN